MKNIRAILSTIVFFIISVASIYYVAHSKILLSQIDKNLNKITSLIMPNTSLSYAKLKFNIGPSVKFFIKDIKINDNSNLSPIIHINEAIAKVSLWSIIAGHGDINVDIEDVMVDESRLANVFNRNVVDVFIPGFISNDRINLKIKNIKNRNIKEISSENRIDRIIVKNFNFKKSSAFEMDLPVKTKIMGHLVSAHLQLIGEFNLDNYLKGSDFKASLVANLTKFQTNDPVFRLPDIKDDVILTINEKGILTLDHVAKLGSLGSVSFKTRNEGGKLYINDIKSTFELDKYNEIFTSTPLAVKALALEHVSLDVIGNVILDHINGKIDNNLEFSLTKPIKVSSLIGKGIEFVGSGSFINDNLKIKLQGQMFNGTFLSDINSKINLFETYLNRQDKFDWKLSFNCAGLQLAPDEIAKYIHRDEIKIPDQDKVIVKDKDRVNNSVSINLKAVCENIFIGKNESSLKAVVNYKANKLDITKLSLKAKSGELAANFAINFTNFESGYYYIKLNKIEVDELSHLLPKGFGTVSGIATGIVSGNYRKVIPSVLHAEVNIDLVNPLSEILNYNELQSAIYDLFENNKELAEFSKRTPVLSKLNVRLKLDQDKIKVDNLFIIEEEKKSSLKLSGDILVGVENGTNLTGEYEDQVLSKYLKEKKQKIKLIGSDYKVHLNPETIERIRINANSQKNKNL